MSKRKRVVRALFNDACIKRDGRCLLCPTYNKTPMEQLEVHHITNRNQMPNGGYVKENGITLCPRHHLAVESGRSTFGPDYLYEMIDSSLSRALDSSKRLC